MCTLNFNTDMSSNYALMVMSTYDNVTLLSMGTMLLSMGHNNIKYCTSYVLSIGSRIYIEIFRLFSNALSSIQCEEIHFNAESVHKLSH
jgi:hypothetical protein